MKSKYTAIHKGDIEASVSSTGTLEALNTVDVGNIRSPDLIRSIYFQVFYNVIVLVESMIRIGSSKRIFLSSDKESVFSQDME